MFRKLSELLKTLTRVEYTEINMKLSNFVECSRVDFYIITDVDCFQKIQLQRKEYVAKKPRNIFLIFSIRAR